MSKSYLKQDEEIRAFAARQHVNTSGTYNNRVLLAIEEGKNQTGQSQRKINFYGKLAVACACVCIITMSGVGVHAAINYANQRMEQVTDGEKEQFISGVNESQASADSYSRPLTDTEKNRMDELTEEEQVLVKLYRGLLACEARHFHSGSTRSPPAEESGTPLTMRPRRAG